ncbi:MAG: hypothetical protein K2I01_09900 [Lachnospiraceae bacterium]|nr:hypothetical protein [Lachnospiraceae bacterium]
MLEKRESEGWIMDYQHRVLPFYMSYSTPYFMREEDSVLKDLEYLQQMYPAQAKQLQKRIAEILDKMDYEGSMLYDEYPDKWQLYRLSENIVTILKQEEEEQDSEPASPEKWEWIKDMVQIVMYYEIYRRRHGGRRGFLKF